MAILRNIQNDRLYKYLGDDTYLNLASQKEGKIEPEMAQKVLKINLEATQLIGEYPILEELICKLDLKIEK